ncbi:MAG: 4-hydroxy-3-methylbut-2-en-1-yl diphosphate synthase [Bacteroidetes bacterium GWA2_32_17]|nr:MAG: 4-hydroxy-3-methylbut-2-en-1-yl diphosphate synthase [Bacteroidetes bacterium GWA2_32_17]
MNNYIQPYTTYSRFKTKEVNIGGIALGGNNPIRIQTMTNTNTLDTKTTVEQITRIYNAGADYVRLTVQGIKEAKNLPFIIKELEKNKIKIPLIADVHYNPKVAEITAQIVSKVRINPGNYTDISKSANQINFTEKQFAEEKEKIRNNLLPLINICKQNGTAIRIGINHGSLSWRIVSKYGNTPKGMVASAMEFIEICEQENFNNIVLSMKASNPLTMIYANRLLVQKMHESNLNYPIHLGVTEAGLGEDGRIKSSIGIGLLLLEGIGDTVRVSLTEAPEKEIPVAKAIIKETKTIINSNNITQNDNWNYNSFSFERRQTNSIKNIGGNNSPILIFTDFKSKNILKQDINNIEELNNLSLNIIETDNIYHFRNKINELDKNGNKNPVILKIDIKNFIEEEVLYRLSIVAGGLFADGRLDGFWITGTNNKNSEKIIQIAYSILQASRARITKTEYVSCPSCGRTLFDIEKAVKEVMNATKQFAGLKIAVMGCVVNGPGEMADSDYGYVGAGNGKVNIYKGNERVLQNVPEEIAVKELVKIINSVKTT